MNELYSEIVCSNAEALTFSLCLKMIEALKDKKITKDDFKTLCTAYYNRGEELNLTEESSFNKNLFYTFKENLHKLTSTYNSA